MDAHQYINSTSGNQEWYTPVDILRRVRLCMGGIDLDVASTEDANRYVFAFRFFTEEEDGLKQHWDDRIWMNHPFGRKENVLWIDKLLLEYKRGFISQACCITYAGTSEKWFQKLMQFPQCFLSPRTNYIDSVTKEPVKGVPKGSVITYLGADVSKFISAFDSMGTFMFPISYIPPLYYRDWREHINVT